VETLRFAQGDNHVVMLSQGRRRAARYKAMTSEGMIHSRCDSLVKAQPPSIVMPDLIGHPGVHIGVQEWPHEERGRLDPRLRGGDGIPRSLCRCPGFWTPACAGVTLTPDYYPVYPPSRTIPIGLTANVIESLSKHLYVHHKG